MNKPDARTLPQEVQKSLREQAIRLHEQGKSWQEVPEIVGVNICTARAWVPALPIGRRGRIGQWQTRSASGRRAQSIAGHGAHPQSGGCAPSG